MDAFDREMQKDSIFVDRNVLSPHFIPDILPHREKEIDNMITVLAPLLKAKKAHNIFLYGKTGTGKTATSKHVVNKLLEAKEKYNAQVDCVYINCRILNSKYQVLLKCAEYCCPNESFMGYPFATLYERVKKFVSDKDTSLLAILDEVDKVKNVDDLMYTLTRINDELEKGRVSLIGITNNVKFKDQLDPRSKSTLCEEEMVFNPYDADQLRHILSKRVLTGFKEGVVEESAVNLAAALAAQESGDARYALKLILKAGDLAEKVHSRKVTDEFVQNARKGVEDEIVLDIIESLPEHQKITLYAIVQLTEEGAKYSRLDGLSDEKILFSGDVYDKYERLCKHTAKSPRSARWVREYINDLEMLGLVTATLSGKGVRGSTTLIKLAFPPEALKDVLSKHFTK